jgi:hypothetical protein
MIKKAYMVLMLLSLSCLALADEMADIIAGTPVGLMPPEAKAMMAGYSIWSMVWATLFGGVGVFAFIYGKKKSNAPYIIIGILLCIYPFIIKDSMQMLIIGAVISAGLYLFRRQ